MSNPYDPYNNQGTPGDPPPPPPYGAPIPSQGGGGAYPPSPYGQDSPYGDGAPKKTDAVSITGFVLSLTCCLSIVGAILGFIGLGRTKNNERKGRWAAIAASIIGVLGTLAFVGGILFLVVFAKSVIGVDDAKVGQCMNVSDSGDSVTLTKKDCTESHDAEIVYVGVKGDIAALGADFVPDNINDLSDSAISSTVCSNLIDPADAEKLADSYTYTIVSKDPKDTANNSPFVCYVEPDNGDKLTDKLLG